MKSISSNNYDIKYFISQIILLWTLGSVSGFQLKFPAMATDKSSCHTPHWHQPMSLWDSVVKIHVIYTDIAVGNVFLWAYVGHLSKPCCPPCCTQDFNPGSQKGNADTAHHPVRPPQPPRSDLLSPTTLVPIKMCSDCETCGLLNHSK